LRETQGVKSQTNSELVCYKHTKLAYGKKLITGESARIGTLRDFADLEKHQLLRGDPDEGTVNILKRASS
jgi:hypothetical protein